MRLSAFYLSVVFGLALNRGSSIDLVICIYLRRVTFLCTYKILVLRKQAETNMLILLLNLKYFAFSIFVLLGTLTTAPD